MEVFSSKKGVFPRLIWNAISFLLFGGMCVSTAIYRPEMTSVSWLFLGIYVLIAGYSFFSALFSLRVVFSKRAKQLSYDEEGIVFYTKRLGPIQMKWENVQDVKATKSSITFEGPFLEIDAKFQRGSVEYFLVTDAKILFRSNFSEQSKEDIYSSINEMRALA